MLQYRFMNTIDIVNDTEKENGVINVRPLVPGRCSEPIVVGCHCVTSRLSKKTDVTNQSSPVTPPNSNFRGSARSRDA